MTFLLHSSFFTTAAFPAQLAHSSFSSTASPNKQALSPDPRPKESEKRRRGTSFVALPKPQAPLPPHPPRGRVRRRLLPMFDPSVGSSLPVRPMGVTVFMELALDQAKFALDNLEVPVGCVIVEDGKVISSGSNKTNATRNATRHAEMEAIDALLQEWQSIGLDQAQVMEKLLGCDLYVTCEPCIMCASALSILGIREVYFGCANDKFGGCGSVMSLHETSSDHSSGSQAPRPSGFKCNGGIMAEEAVALFRNFYEQGNPNAPKPHRPVRLARE